MCIKEAMRLYPSGASNRRELEEDLQLGEHLLPKGSSVMMSLFTVHFDERFWGSDAHLYKPERFQTDVASKRLFHSFSPFGGGLRICVGKTFAETELILSTIRLLQEFEFSWIDSVEWPIKIAQSFTVVPKDGLVVNIKKRH
jgi:cytochrome P450